MGDKVTCELIGVPINYHFRLCCEDCDAHLIAKFNLGKAEQAYYDGRMTQDQFEAYMYCWAVLSPHGGRPEWSKTPENPDVLRIARKIAFFIGVELPE